LTIYITTTTDFNDFIIFLVSTLNPLARALFLIEECSTHYMHMSVSMSDLRALSLLQLVVNVKSLQLTSVTIRHKNAVYRYTTYPISNIDHKTGTHPRALPLCGRGTVSDVRQSVTTRLSRYWLIGCLTAWYYTINSTLLTTMFIDNLQNIF